MIDSAYPDPITCRVTESQAPKRADLPAFRWVDEIVRDEVIEASEQIQKSRVACSMAFASSIFMDSRLSISDWLRTARSRSHEPSSSRDHPLC